MGPCYHGTARPQVAVGGTASNKEGGCEYFEKGVADSRLGVVSRLGVRRGVDNSPSYKEVLLRT